MNIGATQTVSAVMLVYEEIDEVLVNGWFDEKRLESVHSFLKDVVLLSHLVVKLGENRCPTLIVNSDIMCKYRTKTIEVHKKWDIRILE